MRCFLTSGKMVLLLDKLQRLLRHMGHSVLVFSQVRRLGGVVDTWGWH
jgi:hypothetical protein